MCKAKRKVSCLVETPNCVLSRERILIFYTLLNINEFWSSLLQHLNYTLKCDNLTNLVLQHTKQA